MNALWGLIGYKGAILPLTKWHLCIQVTSIANSIEKTRWPYNHLIAIMEFLILVRWHLFILRGQSSYWQLHCHSMPRIRLSKWPSSTPPGVAKKETLIFYISLLTHWGWDEMDAITQTRFKCIFLKENVWILTKKISLKFVPKGPINNIPALVPIMAWRRPGNNPLSEPMMVSFLMHICITWPQWVNWLTRNSNFTCVIFKHTQMMNVIHGLEPDCSI